MKRPYFGSALMKDRFFAAVPPALVHSRRRPFPFFAPFPTVLVFLVACTVPPGGRESLFDVTMSAGSIAAVALAAPAAPVITGAATGAELYRTPSAGSITWAAPPGETYTATLDGLAVESPIEIFGISNGTKNGMNHTLVVTARNSAGLSTSTTVSFSLISAITLYATAGDYTGNVGGRSGADIVCRGDRSVAASGSSCTKIHAFLSFTASDTIAAMTTNFGVPNGVPIKSPSTTSTIGSNWADLLDGTITTSMLAAGITDGVAYWTFSTASGDFDSTNNCGAGASTSRNGGWGDPTQTTKGFWIQESSSACSNSLRFLCVCY